MLCFYSLSSLLIWIFRGVSYVTWKNQDKVFEKTEVGELKQNGCYGHGYFLWLWTFPLFFRSFTRSTVIIRSSGTTRSTCVNLCDLLSKQSLKSSVLSKTTENSTIFDDRFALIRFFDNCWPKRTWKSLFFSKSVKMVVTTFIYVHVALYVIYVIHFIPCFSEFTLAYFRSGFSQGGGGLSWTEWLS